MYCYLCGWIDDWHETGLCSLCRRLLARNNERVTALALLTEAQQYCPLELRVRIEKLLDYIKPPFV